MTNLGNTAQRARIVVVQHHLGWAVVQVFLQEREGRRG